MRPSHTVFCALKRPERRTFLHFLRPFSSSYSATRTYLPSWKKLWPFTTSNHGEERAFIDGSIYETVMPFYVLPIQLVKSVIAEEFDRAIEYGLLEIIPDDFALADFICPSKAGMMKIIREGQKKYISRI
jgi:Na+-transporting NADH:ubiquinone oxidoreductase subunit A